MAAVRQKIVSGATSYDDLVIPPPGDFFRPPRQNLISQNTYAFRLQFHHISLLDPAVNFKSAALIDRT